MIKNKKIYTIYNKKEDGFLRQKTVLFDFSKFSKKEINELIQTMRKTMQQANGVGLSANQIGLNLKVFVAQVDNKFYAVFNPIIKKCFGEALALEEGCLSVPDKLGSVKRSEKVILEGFNKNGKKIKIKAWGMLAHVFQHEIDHLDGQLFIDKATGIRKIKTDG